MIRWDKDKSHSLSYLQNQFPGISQASRSQARFCISVAGWLQLCSRRPVGGWGNQGRTTPTSERKDCCDLLCQVISLLLPHLYTLTSSRFCLQRWKPQKYNNLSSDPVISNFTKDWLFFLLGSGYTHGTLLRRGADISSAGAFLASALQTLLHFWWSTYLWSCLTGLHAHPEFSYIA